MIRQNGFWRPHGTFPGTPGVLKLSDNPPELYLGLSSASINSDPGSAVCGFSPENFGVYPWAVALVGSRKEKTVARWMIERNISYFLPYLREKSASGNTVLSPLFEGIIFFQAHHESIPEGYYTSVTPMEYEVRTAHYVHGVLKTAVQVKLKREMAVIYHDRSLRLCTYEPGEPIKVIGGPWKDFEGSIIRPDPEWPLCQFKMEGLQTWAKVHIPVDQIVRVPDEKPQSVLETPAPRG